MVTNIIILDSSNTNKPNNDKERKRK